MKNVHVISSQSQVVEIIAESFPEQCRVTSSSAVNEALRLLRRNRSDLLFVDMEKLLAGAASTSINEVLQEFWKLYPTLEIVIMTPKKLLRESVKAVREGVSSYITYPVLAEEVRLVAQNIAEQQIVLSELDFLRGQFWQEDALELIQTKCRVMQKVFADVRSVAPTKSTVLLSGETGTGKGVLAQLIHRHSSRKESRFIGVHCGAIPDTLMESELFGHEKGAFTGAIKRKLGKFEIADRGTIFLDEIGTITPTAQIKLLQVLQEGVFQRVGGEETLHTDVRIIAASNIDLKKLCEENLFRADLYYRLNVFPIHLPPLRERQEDIAKLAEIFLARLNKFHLKNIHGIHPRVMEAFRTYSWPGNIREMENIMERAYILEKSPLLTPQNFPAELFDDKVMLSRLTVDTRLGLAEVRRRGVDEIERGYLCEVLEQCRGKIKKSAEVAGITTRQLHKLMKKHTIRKEDFKR